MNKNNRLENKKIIVTGGSRGIGAGIVKRLFDEGAEILIADFRKDLALDLINKLDKSMKKISFYEVDLSKEENIISMFEYIENKWSSLDILINNAAIMSGYPINKQTYDHYKQIISVNMDAPFLCSKYSLPLFKNNKGGKIIMISSIQGIKGYKENLPYNTAKGGLINMTRALAVELAEKNILVNSIAPGFIDTSMSIMKDGKHESETEWFNDVYIKYGKLPMKRYGKVSDIAGAVYFFCSEDSNYVTGQTLIVDGGVESTF